MNVSVTVWHVDCDAVVVVMDIRIDIESEGPVVVLHVAGQLSGSTITQLTDVCKTMVGNFVLDLSKLTFADDAGVEVIRTLLGKGLKIRGASTFIQLLINDKKTSGAENE